MLSTLLLALTTIQTVPALGIERYEVVAGSSTIGFDGTSLLHDFTGKTHAITADLRADRDDPGRLVGGAIWIEAATLDTDNKSRDGEMRDLLDVKHFPQIIFALDSVHGHLVQGKGEFTALGRFTIRGIERPRVVQFHIDPIPPRKDNSGHDIRVQGEVSFKMTEHGIERPGVLFAKVADEVRIWLDLTLRPLADEGIEALVRTVQVEEEFVPTGSDASPRKRTGTELVWTVGARQLWERRLEPVWVLRDANVLASIDPRTGRAQPAADLLRQALDQLAKPGIAGTTWSTAVTDVDGRRILRITFADEVHARLPTWALDPQSWRNGPESNH